MKTSAAQPQNLPTYGGQAVIEGVMMRGRSSCKVAVRTPEKAIQVEDLPLSSVYRSRWATLPFLRGLLVLWDALGLGMRALTFSANVQTGEDAKLEGAPMAITMAFSLLFGVGLFFLLPAGGAYLVGQFTPLSSGWVNIIEGLVRLLLLVGYIWGIGLMPDIQRVYGYHGAEHMTINAFEAGADLQVESVRRYSRQHARCGTAFLLTVVVFSVILFSLLGEMALIPRLVSRLLLLPVLASVAYEYIRLTSRFLDRWWIWPFVAPNLALQNLTTRRPDDSMLEVAIAAFKAMRAAEQEPVSQATAMEQAA
ncbi:MAG: DUF1385 domain-containing protein [Anaerolineales bacterium]|jgi:uncharacterized protein YqhQ